jgi:NADPH-dependent curcumin reductase CurA
MRGVTVGVVKASNSQKFPVGSHAIGSAGWTEMAVVKDNQLEKVDIPSNGKLTDLLGILGEESNFRQSRTIKIDLRWFQDLLV